MNIAMSKDLFKERASLNLNVNDVFNSRKRKQTTFVASVFQQYSEFQWRERQISLNFDNSHEAERWFSTLMGDDVPPRRKFIEDNAVYAKIDA